MNRRFLSFAAFLGLFLALAAAQPAPSQPAASPTASSPLKTRNVIVVMMDGTRWQEVFTGAEDALISKEGGNIDNIDAVRSTYWRDTPQERRALLMPFLWGAIAAQGQVFGNQTLGSVAQIANSRKVSYPGYSETFCGVTDDQRIRDNKAIPNPNVSVLEFLHAKPAFRDRVVVFATWNLFPAIFNVERSALPVVCDTNPVTFGSISPEVALLNRLRLETPERWHGNTFDSLIFHTALNWSVSNAPRVLFIGFGEPDEWAHETNYQAYLDSIRRCDAYLEQLWTALQKLDQYRDSTTLIVLPDHGRGDVGKSLTDWSNHNAQTPGAKNIWLGVIGPDTPALGERANCPPITQSQVASTIAALLGENFQSAVPAAAPPITDVIAPRSK